MKVRGVESVLVIGGAGFMGSHIFNLLIDGAVDQFEESLRGPRQLHLAK